MYWSVGAYLSELCSASSFGDKIIDEVAAYIAQENPNIKGFNRRGLYRMKQFYETYKDDEFVTPLVTQISWTNHLLIMSGSKTAEERHFYMALCAKEHYSKRELERQIGTSYYERSMISAKKPMPESVSHDVRESILDTYVLEFLDLPEQFSEKNALSRSMSPTLVADYRLCLPDKTLLQNKLRELTELALESGEGNEGDEE